MKNKTEAGELVSLQEASVLLHISVSYIRKLMRAGALPIGYAFKGTGKRYTYYIYRNQLETFLSRQKE